MGIRRAVSTLREEAAAWRRLRRDHGTLAAARQRLRERLDLPDLERRQQLVADRLDGLEQEASRNLDQASRNFSRGWELLEEHEQRLSRIERQVRTATVMAWIEQATLAGEPLVSVVIPTLERPAPLARAVESVIAQSYSNWEALIVEDGDTEHTASVVASFEDARVRHLPGDPAGAGATRNRGIAEASGELIAYLDDDNRMHRNWLKSVAWAFEQRPETDVLYGGIVIDDTARHHEDMIGEMPSAWIERYDPETIADANVADTSAIAHRASLANARWDESLKTLADWELFTRLTAEREPLALPAIACFYYTDVPGRASSLKEHIRRERMLVVERARALRGGD